LNPRKKSAAASQRLLFLGLGLALVLACRFILYIWMPDRTSDFDLLYDTAVRLLRGEDLYPLGAQSFPYPLPAVLLAVPFTAIPRELARPVFDVLVGWAFVYALWRYRGSYAILALVSGAYLFAMARGQTTPLMVAASLIPALGFLLAVKPNTSAALWIARPSWLALLGVGLFVGLSFVILPSWPQEWWTAMPLDLKEWSPPLLRPFGFVLLLAGLRWRSPEGRLLFAIAFIPQTILPYELVSLALIPANLVEMVIFVAGSWIAVAVAAKWMPLGSIAGWTPTSWSATLSVVYLPMLYLVLRPMLHLGVREDKIEKERRRPDRLPDDELEVDVTTDGAGGIIVTVTHLPTGLGVTESGETRQLAERKAQDRLAAIVAELPRRERRA
jgi:hypothetical protein